MPIQCVSCLCVFHLSGFGTCAWSVPACGHACWPALEMPTFPAFRTHVLPAARPGYSWSTLDYTTTVPVPAPQDGSSSSGNASAPLGSESGGGAPVRLQLGGPRWRVAHYAVRRVFAPVSILSHVADGRIKVPGVRSRPSYGFAQHLTNSVLCHVAVQLNSLSLLPTCPHLPACSGAAVLLGGCTHMRPAQHLCGAHGGHP
jgi:hypothetical protein